MPPYLDAVAAGPWVLAVVFVVAGLDALLPFMPSESTVVTCGVAAAGTGRPHLALRTDFDRPELAPVAVEFTATSVSSDFPIAFDGPLKALNPTLNPHVRYFDGSRRGYLRCVVNRSAWHTDVRTVETIDVRETPVRTSASYAVEAGASTLVFA